MKLSPATFDYCPWRKAEFGHFLPVGIGCIGPAGGRSRLFDGAALDVVARQSQVMGVLIEPVNQVEQPLAQQLILELLSRAHYIQRRDLVVGGDRVEQLAHAS